MAVGEGIVGISGTGTASDPYKPTTFGEFLTCINVAGSYVCLENDIDVSKDNVYKTGISNYLEIRSAYIFGTAMTYDASTIYNNGDKCTWNDGDHGLCTYTCNVNGTVGVDVSDTTHWTRGGNPTKKITGLIITAIAFLAFNGYTYGKQTMSNVFFESCVYDKTSNYGFMIGNTSAPQAQPSIINDCTFSVFYNQHQYCPAIVNDDFYFSFNRCSLNFKYAHENVAYNYNKIFPVSSKNEVRNCTINLDNISIYGSDTNNPQINIINSSLRAIISLTNTGSSPYFTFSGTNSFYAITLIDVTRTLIIYPTNMYGTSIMDKDVVGTNVLISANSGVIQGTTAQCKDKNWLISQGFFAS